uniref:Ig-like domain-containing protein n=1 Tax=Scleropages formosus TaxID=113540 RepID=A0A8D0CG74_SCLFO
MVSVWTLILSKLYFVTLTCFCTKDEITYIAWFEQPFGQKPQIVAKALFYSQDVEFQAEFENRLSLQWIEATKSFNMTILKTELSDSAVYYCVTVLYNEPCAVLKDFSLITKSYPVRPGDSVTLQCTVDSETCAGEHSVYWFRHGSGESLPGLIYTHGNRSDECERSPEAGSHTHSCIYSLPKRNLSPSDAGIYYCAVATCGDILFGNGTVVKCLVTDRHPVLGVSPPPPALRPLLPGRLRFPATPYGTSSSESVCEEARNSISQCITNEHSNAMKHITKQQLMEMFFQHETIN